MIRHRTRFALLAALALCACGDTARLRVEQGIGPSPVLPPPVHTLIPTVNVVKAVHWPAGAKPVAAPGLKVEAFAAGLDHPRWPTVLPNGDVLLYAVGDFVTATGERLEGRGVVPDETVALTVQALAKGRDPATEAALAWVDRLSAGR